jgi:hypothetical protein
MEHNLERCAEATFPAVYRFISHCTINDAYLDNATE